MEGALRPATLGGMVAESPEQLHHLLAAAFNAGDADAAVALYERDARLIAPPDRREARGAAEIRAAVAETIAMRPTAELRVVGKVQQDGIALTHGRWSMQGTDATGEPVTMSGRGTMVSRLQPDGHWLIALDDAMAPE